jgi:hypothetical protein
MNIGSHQASKPRDVLPDDILHTLFSTGRPCCSKQLTQQSICHRCPLLLNHPEKGRNQLIQLHLPESCDQTLALLDYRSGGAHQIHRRNQQRIIRNPIPSLGILLHTHQLRVPAKGFRSCSDRIRYFFSRISMNPDGITDD